MTNTCSKSEAQPLDSATLRATAEKAEADPGLRIIRNAVTAAEAENVSLDRASVVAVQTSMSHKLDTWPVANQKKSGRCWIFAGLNFLRSNLISDLNLDGFEFSQNYIHFWDKLEKANWFFNAIIDMADRDLDDRTVHQLLKDPIGDGGQWDMFVSLIKKYGLVPKYAMPETISSSGTASMNQTLETLLRRGALKLRSAAQNSSTEVDAIRRELVDEVYRVLTINLGTPPAEFIWQYRTKNNEFTNKGSFTPLEFAKEVVEIELDDYVSLVNDPRESSPFGHALTVDQLGNVVGGRPIRYINAPAAELRRIAMQMLSDGQAVWMGCDVSKQCSRYLGIWSANLHDYQGMYGVDLELTKAERIQTGDSAMTHAMLFTGVNIVDGEPTRWRVENSWGDSLADKGFWTMDDSWFDEYVFEIAVPASLLSDEFRDALTSEPIILPLWDPMGSLA